MQGLRPLRLARDPHRNPWASRFMGWVQVSVRPHEALLRFSAHPYPTHLPTGPHCHDSIDISKQAGVRYPAFPAPNGFRVRCGFRQPYALELAYTREMMSGLLFHDSKILARSLLLIGLGRARSGFVHRHLPRSRSVVVGNRRCMRLSAVPPEDERLQFVFAGR